VGLGTFYFGPTQVDRFGPFLPAVKTQFDQALDRPNGTAPSNFQLYKDAPNIFLSSVSSFTCTKISRGYDCNPGVDLHEAKGSGGPEHSFISAFYPIVWGGAGTRAYGSMSYSFKYTAYQANPSIGSPTLGFDPGGDYVDVNTDNWLANAIPQIFAAHLQKYILSPLANAPDYGPQIYSGVRQIPGNGGTLHILGSWSEESQVVTVNLSRLSLGGPIRRYTITRRGIRVDSLLPSTASDTVTLQYGAAVAYVFQPTGMADELVFKTFTFNPPAFGASKIALEIHYYPKDDPLAIYDCSSTCTVPLDLNGVTPVWYRYSYLAANGAIVSKSDLQRLP
jgi:hypothetical protein